MDRIILASSSPRRRQLLDKFNIRHRVVENNYKEKINLGEKPEHIVMSLAFQKAYNVGKDNLSDIIIAADTIIVFEDEIIGKPRDEEDAFNILKKLNGRTHDVLTGICIMQADENKKIVDYERTRVRFRELDDEKIKSYIFTKEPLGKAGAYAIQGYGGLLVESIEGCYNNIIGLPINKIQDILEEQFNIEVFNNLK